MRYLLENEILRAEADSLGAELKSVKRKSDGREFLWQADPKYWGRTSPVLFPFVGACRDGQYRYEGKTYPMGQHGFARDMEFTLERQSPDEIWFVLESDLRKISVSLPAAYRLPARGRRGAGVLEGGEHR